jgi:hypothetical protein
VIGSPWRLAGAGWSVLSQEHIARSAQGTSAGHVCVYCRRGSERTGAGTFGGLDRDLEVEAQRPVRLQADAGPRFEHATYGRRSEC